MIEWVSLVSLFNQKILYLPMFHDNLHLYITAKSSVKLCINLKFGKTLKMKTIEHKSKRMVKGELLINILIAHLNVSYISILNVEFCLRTCIILKCCY